MRLLFSGDLHIGATHLTTLDDQRRALGHICDLVQDRHVDAVLLGGDLTHHARPSPEVMDILGAFFARLGERGVEVVCVAGNHDPLVPAVAQHFRGRVHVALTPRTFRLDGLDVCALPWLPDAHVRSGQAGTLSKEEVAAQLTFAARSIIAGFRAQRRPGVPLAFVGHLTVAGAETSTGWGMGFIPGTQWLVPADDLAEFDLSLVAHIHRHQTMGERIIYSGSLLPLDFSETEEKGIVVADLGPGQPVQWEFVEIPTPKVMTLDVTGIEQLRELIET